jgi:hypothetical protein
MRNIQISNKLENNMGGDNPNREAISKGGAHFLFICFSFLPQLKNTKPENKM